MLRTLRCRPDVPALDDELEIVAFGCLQEHEIAWLEIAAQKRERLTRVGKGPEHLVRPSGRRPQKRRRIRTDANHRVHALECALRHPLVFLPHVAGVIGDGADDQHGLGDAPEFHTWVMPQDAVDNEILAQSTAQRGEVVVGRGRYVIFLI